MKTKYAPVSTEEIERSTGTPKGTSVTLRITFVVKKYIHLWADIPEDTDPVVLEQAKKDALEYKKYKRLKSIIIRKNFLCWNLEKATQFFVTLENKQLPRIPRSDRKGHPFILISGSTFVNSVLADKIKTLVR